MSNKEKFSYPGCCHDSECDRQTLKVEKTAFCRCGMSNNKTFCDDSHQDAGTERSGI